MPDEVKETQPLLKDILEEMRAGFRDVNAEMRAGFAEMREFRTETNDRLLRIEKRLSAIEGEMKINREDWFEMRAKQSDLERRTLDLERRAE